VEDRDTLEIAEESYRRRKLAVSVESKPRNELHAGSFQQNGRSANASEDIWLVTAKISIAPFAPQPNPRSVQHFTDMLRVVSSLHACGHSDEAAQFLRDLQLILVPLDDLAQLSLRVTRHQNSHSAQSISQTIRQQHFGASEEEEDLIETLRRTLVSLEDAYRQATALLSEALGAMNDHYTKMFTGQYEAERLAEELRESQREAAKEAAVEELRKRQSAAKDRENRDSVIKMATASSPGNKITPKKSHEELLASARARLARRRGEADDQPAYPESSSSSFQSFLGGSPRQPALDSKTASPIRPLKFPAESTAEEILLRTSDASDLMNDAKNGQKLVQKLLNSSPLCSAPTPTQEILGTLVLQGVPIRYFGISSLPDATPIPRSEALFYPAMMRLWQMAGDPRSAMDSIRLAVTKKSRPEPILDCILAEDVHYVQYNPPLAQHPRVFGSDLGRMNEIARCGTRMVLVGLRSRCREDSVHSLVMITRLEEQAQRCSELLNAIVRASV
jgi:hypothetical protein